MYRNYRVGRIDDEYMETVVIGDEASAKEEDYREMPIEAITVAKLIRSHTTFTPFLYPIGYKVPANVR
jgi:hypothetical protein